MPKLLLVGIVERACLKTIIREIPGITDCFKSQDDGGGGEVVYRVSHVFDLTVVGELNVPHVADN